LIAAHFPSTFTRSEDSGGSAIVSLGGVASTVYLHPDKCRIPFDFSALSASFFTSVAVSGSRKTEANVVSSGQHRPTAKAFIQIPFEVPVEIRQF
jgi:hypothetical protein